MADVRRPAPSPPKDELKRGQASECECHDSDEAEEIMNVWKCRTGERVSQKETGNIKELVVIIAADNSRTTSEGTATIDWAVENYLNECEGAKTLI